MIDIIRKYYLIVGRFLLKIFYRYIKRIDFIVVIEGGITSQIEQYIIGKLLESKGYVVQYDLSFYVKNGLDCTGEHLRNFDLKKINRSIQLKEADKQDLLVFNRFFSYPTYYTECNLITTYNIPKPPIYVNGYNYGFLLEKEYEKIYKQKMKIDYDADEFGIENASMYMKIINDKYSVGVHVRRGDTLLENVGRPIPKPAYYFYAMSFFDNPNSHFYFFSDDIEWVRENITSKLEASMYTLVTNNGDDRGWCDLILMSACKYQIKSPAGGLGREAYRLNEYKDKLLVMPCLKENLISHVDGKSIEVVLNEKLCDMSYVKNYNVRL